MAQAITLSPELAYRSISPSTAFLDAYQDPKEQFTDNNLPWDASHLNPKNRIDSLTSVETPKWRIDGCTSLGTQFFSVPALTSPVPPLRVDTFLPDPAHWPVRLRLDLNLDEAFLFRDSRINHFSICQHVLRALEFWSASISEFETLYKELPFGSRIMFENMSKDIRKIRIRVIRTHDLERRLLPLTSLKSNRILPLPENLDISKLSLVRQLQDSASLVRILGSDEKDFVVFKTLSDTPDYLYHELQILLSMPQHENIVSRPRNIVTKQCKFGGKLAILGFTIEYHKQGSLRDILAFRRLHGTLNWGDQIKWASQVVRALQHIKLKGPGWYCDLRLDNILLSDKGDVILIDFEQRGVLPAFASPIDNYLQYINTLIHNPSLTATTRKEFVDLYDVHLRPFIQKRRDHYRGCVSWMCMSKSERDASEMYMLGRLLWCIFEGVSAPQKELWMEYLHEPDVEFPEFRRTPKQLRELILSCVPDWTKVDRTLQRQAYTLNIQVPSENDDQEDEDVFEGMHRMWQEELGRAKVYLQRRGDQAAARNVENYESSRLTYDDVFKKLQESLLVG
ncbi:kinase-like domain-containing protein [Rhexocercosporidium sp. MPI-PUGE-AT-0058]|nr:kinase-like domain-containing protein [Rhexocercosporidium sp. MPI-PUGE-AT-0058]